jgi:hypothetical protein
MSEKIRAHHLQRKAVLYIRQSSPYQVLHNVESQKLQYAMQDHLRRLGWQQIEIIDEDLGRSAAGTATRAGFERMVAQVCLGQVGAVAAREVSTVIHVASPLEGYLLMKLSAAKCYVWYNRLR